ncbi:hypothetical protein BZG36_01978 [Bifiguratus adelaidae]|uniref:Uncharacterized protein n=1 Tax=Bifiguratus adelaidae TaxID=1938954 RepID=A0A261Y445_9FUNG|nr:hypothetical protein BZG36_01978 [Bifiguratus adelaidae]
MVQTKFRKEGFYGQDIEHSIIAVTVPHLYHRVKIDTVQDGNMTDFQFQSAISIISQTFVGTISLVVVYPAVAKYESDVESLRSDEIKAKGPMIGDPHYLLFIGRDNPHLLFDRELLEELQSFKGPKRRRRS